MKKVTYILLALSFFISCNKNDNPIDKGAKQGGLFELFTETIVYDIGNAELPYPIELKYYNVADSKIKSIDVYHQFFTLDDDNNPISSEITYFKSINLSMFNSPGYLTFNVTFKELAKATMLNNLPIDTIDSELKSGFKWKLTYKAIMQDGRIVQLDNKETVFENLKLLDDISIAGTYDIVEKKYFRIGVLRNDLDANWDDMVTITAINSKTFVLGTKIGPFEDAGNVVFSFLDEGNINTYNIKYYKSYVGFSLDDLLLNEQPPLYCPEDGENLINVGACASGTNTLVRGTKDTLIMSFGYNATSGDIGPREFYYKMVKQ